MKYRIRGLAILLLVTAPVFAAGPGDICAGQSPLSLGQWASYQTDVPLLNKKMESRYAVVATEAVDGKEHFWLEMLVPMAGGTMIMQFLVPGYPYDGDTVRGMVMKMGDAMPAMVYPPEMAGSMSSNDSLSNPLQLACDESELGTVESVTVPAGTFRALRVPARGLGKDIWISADVPFGVIKMAEPDGKGLELVAYGADAESLITETPQKMPGME